MVILLSALTALPSGVVALRPLNARLGGAELAGAFATSIFGGTLVLATLAPLVAIYYHTSSKAGLPVALGSVFLAALMQAVALAAPIIGTHGTAFDGGFDRVCGCSPVTMRGMSARCGSSPRWWGRWRSAC